MPLAIQAVLLFNEIVTLLFAGLAEQLGGGIVPRNIAAIVPHAPLQSYSVQSVPDGDLDTATQAKEVPDGLRFCDVSHVGDGHEGCLGDPLRIYILPVPKQGHQD